jgi:peptidoglycan/xylan/chitin deacetylase (PgdA/CDA1 family)
VAQWLAQATHNRLVAGSNPAGPTFDLRFWSQASFQEMVFESSRATLRLIIADLRLMKFPLPLLTLLLLILVSCNNAPVTQQVSAPTGESMTFKNTVVSLTFDDGDADNYTVRSVLSENNLHATFYIISGFSGTDGFMTEGQLRGLYKDGNEIGGHTVDHKKLSEVRGADLRHEVCQNRIDLLNYGFDVVSFAYPFGYYDAESKQMVIDCGYNNARVVTDGPDIIPPGDAYALQAMPYIVKDVRLPKMLRYITQVEDAGGGWVIFVFHHICDKCDHYATDMETFKQFAQWLKESQVNGLVVKTVGEVVRGNIKPGVAP